MMLFQLTMHLYTGFGAEKNLQKFWILKEKDYLKKKCLPHGPDVTRPKSFILLKGKQFVFYCFYLEEVSALSKELFGNLINSLDQMYGLRNFLLPYTFII